jgi:diamine N-acetyltransferase
MTNPSTSTSSDAATIAKGLVAWPHRRTLGHMADLPVSLHEITDANRDAVSGLHVASEQEQFVGGVAESIEEAAATPEGRPWYRAIYAGDEPVGFVMLSWDVTPAPRILGPWFLWRLLIDARYQRRGYGRTALGQIVEIIRAAGARELLTSYEPGVGEPWPFYEKFGFVPTGEIDGTEVVLRLDLTDR